MPELAPTEWLQRLLRSAPTLTSLEATLHAWQAEGDVAVHPVDQAFLTAARADRLAWVFTAGYLGAVAHLFGASVRVRVLAATESEGGHPRAIHTAAVKTPDGYELTGIKQWVTFGEHCQEMLVVARDSLDEANTSERPSLGVFRVAMEAPGVTRVPIATTPFAPELTHTAVSLDKVFVSHDARLPGDGYDLYVKPFRSVEDPFVLGSTLAWFLRMGWIHDWGKGRLEEGAALLFALRALTFSSPSAPSSHLTLSGLTSLTRKFFEDCMPGLSRTNHERFELFQRDKALLAIAERARGLRTLRAWQSFEPA